MKQFFIFTALILLSFSSFAQNGEKNGQGDIIKTGLSFGPLPVVAFDQDKGFQYGAILNLYNFGDGATYPTPLSQWYIEASLFAKDGHFANSQLFVVNYDNKSAIPGVRFCASASFQNEKALDFYGMNGYMSVIDSNLPTSFYKITRMLPYFKLDFTGKIAKNFYWKAGYHFKYFNIKSFSAENLTEAPGEKTLFDWYKDEGIFSADDVKGGFSSSLRAGLMYDSRNFEAAPSRGIWTEASIEYAPKWLGTSKTYGKYYAAWRHYIPFVGPDKLVFAYRLNIQGYLGNPAFYVLPFDSYLGYGYDRDGFGGYRNIRGIMRNRIQGKATWYYNAELRWRFVSFKIGKQNINLALSGFCDGGSVIVPFGDSVICADATSVYKKSVSDLKEKIHVSAGGGFRFIMNQNFIVAVEYGRAFNRQDNFKGGAFYVNTGFLF